MIWIYYSIKGIYFVYFHPNSVRIFNVIVLFVMEMTLWIVFLSLQTFSGRASCVPEENFELFFFKFFLEYSYYSFVNVLFVRSTVLSSI